MQNHRGVELLVLHGAADHLPGVVVVIVLRDGERGALCCITTRQNGARRGGGLDEVVRALRQTIPQLTVLVIVRIGELFCNLYIAVHRRDNALRVAREPLDYELVSCTVFTLTIQAERSTLKCLAVVAARGTVIRHVLGQLQVTTQNWVFGSQENGVHAVLCLDDHVLHIRGGVLVVMV